MVVVIPLPQFISTFIFTREAKALRCTSSSHATSPLSQQEQLFVMTRRANDMQWKLRCAMARIAMLNDYGVDDPAATPHVRGDPDKEDLSCSNCGQMCSRWETHFRVEPDDRVICTDCLRPNRNSYVVTSTFIDIDRTLDL